MSAKDARQSIRKFMKAGLQAVRTGGGHFKILTAAGKFLTTIGSTPSSSRTVRNTEAAVRRGLRDDSQPAPAQPPALSAAAVSAAAATATAGRPAEPQARPSKRDARRARRAAEERHEALVAERIEHKAERKARPEPAVPAEWVQPQNKKANKYGAARLTTPTGEAAAYSFDVARRDGREVRREDVHPLDSMVFWKEAKATGKTPSCMSCFAPGATGFLSFTGARWIDRRDIYLALGKPFRQAVAKATQDHREVAFTGRANGEYTGTGAMTLCGRCHDRFRASGLRLNCDWSEITNWQAYLAELVTEHEGGRLEIHKPPDVTLEGQALGRQADPDFRKLQVVIRRPGPAPDDRTAMSTTSDSRISAPARQQSGPGGGAAR